MVNRPSCVDGARDAYARSADSVLAQLRVDPTRGLPRAEATYRIEQYGENSLAVSEGVRWPIILARQFADVLIAILAAAAVLSLNLIVRKLLGGGAETSAFIDSPPLHRPHR